jgi:hypothetical protein
VPGPGRARPAGATDIYKIGILAAHPGGTAKIGEIVDANLKTRIDNLYVCDRSVIPEAWGLPPTLTLVALGKRLARHLAAKQRPALLSKNCAPAVEICEWRDAALMGFMGIPRLHRRPGGSAANDRPARGAKTGIPNRLKAITRTSAS